jgi:hypothetical protein
MGEGIFTTEDTEITEKAGQESPSSSPELLRVLRAIRGADFPKVLDEVQWDEMAQGGGNPANNWLSFHFALSPRRILLMRHQSPRTLVSLSLAALLMGGPLLVSTPAARAADAPGIPLTVWILTRSGRSLEGKVRDLPLRAQPGELAAAVPVQTINLRDVLDLRMGAPASPEEQATIQKDLAAVAGTEVAARDAAVLELSRIGLPVISPLLVAYKDTDLRQPNPLYRLFARLTPGHADDLRRDMDLVRTDEGETARARFAPTQLTITLPGGVSETLPLSQIRHLAVRRATLKRTFEVDALRHCTQIEFLDTGMELTANSKLEQEATGTVRMAFGEDGWASGPNGIQKPGPNYQTNLVDGFPFGSLVGRVGVGGARWLAGSSTNRTGAGPGRLYLAVNDNPHWQNNLGSFRVSLRVTNAYDLNDPQ